MAYPDRLDCALSLLLPPAFWLGVWQLGAWLVELHVEGRGNELLLPYPVTVLLALLRLARSPEFWWTALASPGPRRGRGWRAARPWASCWPPSPAPVPGAAACSPPSFGSSGPRRWSPFILLVLLWTGRDLVPAVIAGLMVSSRWCGRERDPGAPGHRRAAAGAGRAYRFSRWKTVRLVATSLPAPLSALRRRQRHRGWPGESGVAAEVLCLPRLGIGAQISRAKQAPSETAGPLRLDGGGHSPPAYSWAGADPAYPAIRKGGWTVISRLPPHPLLRGEAGAGGPPPSPCRSGGVTVPVRPLRLQQDYPTALSGRTGAPGGGRIQAPPRETVPALSGGPPVPLAHGGAAPDGCAPTGPLGGGPRWLDLAGLTGRGRAVFPPPCQAGCAAALALVRALALGDGSICWTSPSPGWTPPGSRRLMEALRALDTPVLLSSHEALVCSLADRVICLDGPRSASRTAGADPSFSRFCFQILQGALFKLTALYFCGILNLDQSSGKETAYGPLQPYPAAGDRAGHTGLPYLTKQ